MRNSISLDPLLTPPMQGILAALLVEREEPWYLSDLAKRLARTPSTLQRPLEALTSAGILSKQTDGNRVYYSRNLACPILPELQGLLLKTVGLSDVIRRELEPFVTRLSVAFLYGSTARGEETSQSDVDLFIVGEASLAELTPALKRMEQRLSRPVNVTLFPQLEFREKLEGGNHFVTSVLAEKKLFVVGTANDLERLSEPRPGHSPQD